MIDDIVALPNGDFMVRHADESPCRANCTRVPIMPMAECVEAEDAPAPVASATAADQARPEFDMAIGDLASTEKGTGARANGGKPDLSLIPLDLLATHLDLLKSNTSRNEPITALESLGVWQRTRDESYLFDVLSRLGSDGWEECARVFEYGKRKYAAWNWAKGMPWSVPLACAARHLLAMIRGEELDPESGHPHRGHVFCNVVMLLQYGRTYQEGDDLPPKGLL